MATAAKNYTLLAIGDGLVAQIPALIISTAAGLVVSRVGTDQNISTQLAGQLFSQPQVLILTAAIIGLMGLIPGMPHIAFLLLAAVLGGGAYLLTQRSKQIAAQAPAMPVAQPEVQDASWDDVMPVDILGLEVGYRLIPLVDRAQDGELLRRIKTLLLTGDGVRLRARLLDRLSEPPPAIAALSADEQRQLRDLLRRIVAGR